MSPTFSVLAREFGLRPSDVSTVVGACGIPYQDEPGHCVVTPEGLVMLRPLLERLALHRESHKYRITRKSGHPCVPDR